VILHGLLGLSYLAAGFIAAVLAAISVAVFAFRNCGARTNSGGSP